MTKQDGRKIKCVLYEIKSEKNDEACTVAWSLPTFEKPLLHDTNILT